MNAQNKFSNRTVATVFRESLIASAILSRSDEMMVTRRPPCDVAALAHGHVEVGLGPVAALSLMRRRRPWRPFYPDVGVDRIYSTLSSGGLPPHVYDVQRTRHRFGYCRLVARQHMDLDPRLLQLPHGLREDVLTRSAKTARAPDPVCKPDDRACAAAFHDSALQEVSAASGYPLLHHQSIRFLHNTLCPGRDRERLFRWRCGTLPRLPALLSG